MNKESVIGIITGDLLNSSLLNKNQRDKLQQELSNFLDQNTDVLLPIRFYRGDSFQLMVYKESALQITLIIEAILLSTCGTLARISIGIGTASKIVKGDVLQSEGEAFLLSGHQLDGMKAEGRLLKIAINSSQFQPILSASFYLTESIILGWKPGQAAVIAKVPFYKTQKEIAQKLGITAAAVSKSIKSGKWPALQSFLIGYNKTLKAIYP